MIRTAICDSVGVRGRACVQQRGIHPGDGALAPRPDVLGLRRSILAGGNIFGEPMCVMMRRETLAQTGWWNDSQPYYIDLGTYVQALVRGTFVALPESLAAFRVSDTQWSFRLANEQRKQAARFHARIRAEHPQVVSRADVTIGDTMAAVAALRRRVAYLWLGRRMQ